MIDLRALGRLAWRKFITDGDAGSGVHEPDKDDIRDFVDAVDEEVANALNRAPLLLASVAGTNTITASGVDPIAAYEDGQSFWIQIANTNSGAVTLNVDSKGAKPLRDFADAALAAGALQAGVRYLVMLDMAAGAGAGHFKIVGSLAAGDATETTKGVVELATTAESAAGTDTVRAVTPAGVAAAIASPRAYGAIGDIVFALYATATAVNPDDSIAGSLLAPTGLQGDSGPNIVTGGAALSGTWKARGYKSSSSAGRFASLWIRTA